MYGFIKIYMLLIGSNIIIVASVSNFKSNNQTSTSDNGVPYKRNIQRVEPLERMRRLIPYMTFYIPTPNREYLPTAPYGHRQTNPYLYQQETATIPTNPGPQHLYLQPAVSAIRKPSLPGQSAYVDDKINKKFKQPQKITKNVFVTPLVDVVIPQHSYQLNSDVYNNEQAGSQLVRPSDYLNEHRSNSLTPFLPSNQVPGPFRPIISSIKNYTLDFPNKISNTNNHVKYSSANKILKESLPIALTKHHDFTSQGYYVTSTSSTENPITNNGIDDSIQQVYVLDSVVKPEIRGQKSKFNQNYISQGQQQHYKPIPTNVQNIKTSTKISYDLDPDDGYGGRVLLPYESYYTKDYKSVPHIQTTVRPTYLHEPIQKPLNNQNVDYDFKAEPINGFEPYDPYELSVTTLDTHQHLTETTPFQQLHKNRTAAGINPITYDNSISPPSSSKPIQDVLNSMNAPPQQLLLKLKEHNYLPKTFTMNKLDNSLRTLAKVLVDFKKSPKPIKAQEFTTVGHSPKIQAIKNSYENVKPVHPIKSNAAPGTHSGEPEFPLPAYATIPKTSFKCSEQRYKGFFGDPEAGCQVWHYCDLNGGQASFLCPNGTIFSQVLLTCDWWFNVKCSSTAQLYVLNERLYKYILPLNPKFPEDYSGPIVDKYLAIKFQEMEDKMRFEKNRNRANNEEQENSTEDTTTEYSNEETEESVPTENSMTDEGAKLTTIDLVDMEPTIPDQRHYYQTTTFLPPIPSSLPPPPKFQVESERAEVIEIRSDGSTGHLTPGRNRR